MSEEEITKQMANLLRSGAAMLAEQCPKCGGILFRLRGGEILCPRCAWEAKGEQAEPVAAQIETSDVLAAAERAVLSKLSAISGKMLESSSPSEVESLAKLCNELLLAAERIRNLKKG